MENQYNISSTNFFENIDVFSNNQVTRLYPVHKEVLIFTKKTTDSDNSLLADIMKAVKQDMENVEVVQLQDNERINLGNFFDSEYTNICVCFGLSSDEVGIHFELKAFQPMLLKAKKILLSVSLDKIAADKILKKELWKGLQAIFPI